MNKLLVLLATLTVTPWAFGQAPERAALQKPATSISKCSDCVSEDLASLSVVATDTVHRAGERLAVTLVLAAGKKGVYLPAYFGDFMSTCEHGFSAALLTLAGGAADPVAVGCGGGGGHPLNDSALTELHNFVYLRPGETRVWSTTIETGAIPPGEYLLVSEYISAGYKINEVASLPQVRGLMAIGRIDAKTTPVVLSR